MSAEQTFLNHGNIYFDSFTVWTFSVNSCSNHLLSLMTSLTGKPSILAFKKSGTC